VRCGFNFWCRFIFPYLIYAARGLDFITRALPGDEGTREGDIGKIDGRRNRHAAPKVSSLSPQNRNSGRAMP
jgi:hypothetical protein